MKNSVNDRIGLPRKTAEKLLRGDLVSRLKQPQSWLPTSRHVYNALTSWPGLIDDSAVRKSLWLALSYAAPRILKEDTMKRDEEGTSSTKDIKKIIHAAWGRILTLALTTTHFLTGPQKHKASHWMQEWQSKALPVTLPEFDLPHWPSDIHVTSTAATSRGYCDKCHRRAMWCIECKQDLRVMHGKPATDLPTTPLPMDLTVLFHERAHPSSCTAPQLAVLCPQNKVDLVQWPTAREWPADGSVWLLWPDQDAQTVEEISEEDIQRVKEIIVLEGTWPQAEIMANSPSMKNLPRVKLSSIRSMFWKFSSRDASCVSTLEAIFNFFVQADKKNEHKFDDLLFYFKIGFDRTMAYYRTNPSLIPPLNWEMENED